MATFGDHDRDPFDVPSALPEEARRRILEQAAARLGRREPFQDFAELRAALTQQPPRSGPHQSAKPLTANDIARLIQAGPADGGPAPVPGSETGLKGRDTAG